MRDVPPLDTLDNPFTIFDVQQLILSKSLELMIKDSHKYDQVIKNWQAPTGKMTFHLYVKEEESPALNIILQKGLHPSYRIKQPNRVQIFNEQEFGQFLEAVGRYVQ